MIAKAITKTSVLLLPMALIVIHQALLYNFR
jgi:hypothetical protein